MQATPATGKHLYADNRRPAHKGRAVAIYGNGKAPTPISVIYQTTEDDADDTIVPRFIKANGTENACCSSAKRKAH